MSTDAETNTPKKPSKDKKEHKAGGSQSFAKWGVVLSIVLALIAIALSYVIWVRSQQQWHTSQLQLQSQWQSNNQQSANSLATMNAKVQQLSHRVNEASSQSASVRALNEASYFVRLANMNLNFNRNQLSASRLLKQADQQIVIADNPALDAVRQQLLTNISQLKNNHYIDATAVLLQLNQLIKQVMALKVIPNTLPKDKPVKNEPIPSGWKSGLNHAWTQLKSLVVIRHQNQDIEPLLKPEQFNFLKDNIALQLVEAQWAILHQSNKLYQQALQNAIDWLKQYDNHNQAAVGPIVSELKSLKQQNAKPDYPNLLDTLKTISTSKQSLGETAMPAAAPKPSKPLPSILSTNKTPKVMQKGGLKNENKKESEPPSLKKLLPKTNKSVEI